MHHLKRELGLFDIIVYALGCIIGAGIYILVGKAAGITGNSVWISFVFAGIIAALTGLSYAELSSSYPVDSAEYRYSRIAFKDRRFSFGIGWLKAFTMIIAASAVSIGFGGYLEKLTGWNYMACAVGLLVFVTVLAIIGIRSAMWVELLLVALTIIGLLMIIVFGFGHVDAATSFDVSQGWPSVFIASSLIFFAYLGFENIANLGGEVKDPQRTLPLGFLISIGISAVLYVLVALVSTNVIPWQSLAASDAPLAEVVFALLGRNWSVVLAIMALCATSSTVLASVVGGSRMFYGMAEEKSFPAVFARLNRRETPWFAVLIVGIISLLFLFPGDITVLASLVNFGALFLFIVTNLALIRIRFTHPHLQAGFRVPFNIGRFPVLPLVAIASCIWLLAQFDKKVFPMFLLFFIGGIALYVIFWERKHESHVAEKGERFHGKPPAPAAVKASVVAPAGKRRKQSERSVRRKR